MSPETCSETSWPECAFATEIWNAMVVAEDAVPSPGGSLRRRRLILKMEKLGTTTPVKTV